MLFRLGVTFIVLCLTACSSTPYIAGYPVNNTLQALGQNSRVRHLVLHYTSLDTAGSIKALTEKNVSSHYLITDDSPPQLYQFVDEQQRAWHAGLGSWYDYPDLNTSSIGIEIVNLGRQQDGSWHPYQPAQIELLIALLRDLVARHRISPANLVAHSDIAPQRKIDPGPLFPWAQLAAAGLGRWYDVNIAQDYQRLYEQHGLPDTAQIQQLLNQKGYAISITGQWDKTSQNVLTAFQMHYRPQRYDGQPDTESIAILQALDE